MSTNACNDDYDGDFKDGDDECQPVLVMVMIIMMSIMMVISVMMMVNLHGVGNGDDNNDDDYQPSEGFSELRSAST